VGACGGGPLVGGGAADDGGPGDARSAADALAEAGPAEDGGAAARGPGLLGIACGTAHTCALGASGAVWCWGDGRRGQLGLGADDAGAPRVREALGPGAPVAGLRRARALAAGGDTTCALDDAGAVWCWGRNDHGQAGDPALGDRLVPTEVRGLPPARAVGVGFSHACALDLGGAVWCWGFNGAGGVLPGGPRSVTTPARAPLPEGQRAVVAGVASTCALDAEGRARCLGEPAQRPPDDAPRARAALVGVDWTCLGGSAPLRCYGALPGGAGRALGPEGEALGPAGVEAGSGGGVDHGCVLADDGALWCFGKNDRGQLGGPMARGPEAVRVTLPGRAVAVAVGATHTCALVAEPAGADAAAWCWGANEHGELGDGSRVASLSPGPVVWP
jgi:alpha-tubulin suppressor-like RCC1 family protein